MGLAQHHDAVSGTEKQEVAFDYAMRLAEGIDSAVVGDLKIESTLLSSVIFQDVINQAYAKLLPKNEQIAPPKLPQFLCQLANISECLPIEGQDRVGEQLSFKRFHLCFSSLVHIDTVESNSTYHRPLRSCSSDENVQHP